MYHRRHFSFHSWISCARENTFLSRARIIGRRSLFRFPLCFSLSPCLPANIFFGREKKRIGRTKGNRKRDSEALQRKKRAAKNVRGMSIAHMCMFVHAYVCVHIFTIYTYIYTRYVYVLCVCGCGCMHRRDISVSSESQEIDLFHITS